MKKVIKSKNQKGGITAHTVNMGDYNQHGKSSKKSKTVWIVTGVVVPIFTVVLTYYLNGPNMKDKITSNVTSYNQSGGITAHTVNVQVPQRRVLDDNLKNQLLTQMPSNYRFRVTAFSGDSEALLFANQIVNFLRENNRNADGVGILMSPNIVIGLHANINRTDEICDITVGIKE